MKLYDTLIDLLEDVQDLDREIRFIDGEKDESTLRFGALRDEALALLGALQARGMQAGDELIIFSKSNRSFVIAFWAAVLGGIVPVPVAVGISDEHKLKLFRILSQLDNPTLFTEMNELQRLVDYAQDEKLEEILKLLETHAVLMSDVEPGAHGQIHDVRAGDIGFIQYSSGSTSDPKGVVLTHRNLCVNIRAIVAGFDWNDEERSLSWMPLTHDMGLIGFHLSVLAAGMDHAVMDTNVFVRRPLLWMSKASELRSTQLCSPNFGYKHFLKLYQRKGLPGIDLSCVKRIINGAEPISWDLCEEFLAALAPAGLARNTMLPVYGLAEATVGVSFSALGSEYERVVMDRHTLQIGATYRPVDAGDADAVSFVKVGKAIRDVDIRIADDADQALSDGHIGHIQLHGDSVTERIYGDAAATAELFTVDGWLRTGDCGVFVDGDLVITGREKDIIIVNGQNYYPHDIEEIVAQLDELDLNKVVVAGATPKGGQTEELIAFVLFRQDAAAFRPLVDKVRDIVGEHAGLEVNTVIPVTRIPKTTSGKVQRAKLLTAYLEGEFDAVLAEVAPVPEKADTDYDADPLVAELEQICHEVAKDRRIGADDNLFEVGVSSLTLTEIVLAIDERHPGKLDISDLFDYPTLREIAALLKR
ncbi:MAG: non-ribosomal peptide synthetase [Woeseiaceae bacterium]|nr:non-ribosomal peptide synthetase [Woeseiaceae bacterium]